MNKTIVVCPHTCDKETTCRHQGGHEEGIGCEYDCKVGTFKAGGCITAGDEEEIT